jgi:hypothetical protein
MNGYPVDVFAGTVPYALTTTNWCTNCTNIMNENREMWEREEILSGTPPYPPMPYSEGEAEN